MKRLKAIVMVGLSLATCAHADEFKQKAKKIQTTYNAGVLALNKGKVEEARAAFNEVLKMQPGHGPARNQLNQLPQTVKRVRLQYRQDQFKKTKISKLEIQDASLEEALEALSYLTEVATEKKFTPNFVLQDPSGKLAGKQVNLTMKNIPLSAALKYVLQQTGASVRIDEHATIIRPN